MKKHYRVKSGLSGKILFDKYHTPRYLASFCVEQLNEYLSGVENISFLDPCAGDGSFSDIIPFCEAYDIAPESETISRADFLKLDVPYKPGRVVVGNPPYGSRLNMAVLFFKKAVSLGDYVAFILPLSQLNNNKMFYEFDLVKSIDTGKHAFSGTPVHSVFNIYKRPVLGQLNQKPQSHRYSGTLSDITIHEVRVKNKIISDYDIRICAWGSVGKPILDGEHYAKEIYLKVNRTEIRDKVISLINNADWVKLYSMKGVCNLAQWHVVKYLKDNINDLS